MNGCADEGADSQIGYMDGLCSREWPGLWWAVPAVMVLAVVLSMLWPMGWAP